ncbi:MAG: prepilin-type N-terminal cleavage/methylation domain-containing protein [Luteolibacter sp.]
MKNPSPRVRRGFTIIELLVAMAITTLIVTVLVSVTSLSLETWNRSRSEIRASRQGKAMVDSMANDFEAMVSRRGNSFDWLFARTAVPTSGPNGNNSPNAAEIAFLSAATDRYNGAIGETDDKGGDVSGVAYKLTYQDTIVAGGDDSLNTFALYRKIINPDETFKKMLGTAYDSGTPSSDALLVAAVQAESDDDITGDAIETRANYICENIYQFTLIFHVAVTKTDGTPGTAQVSLGGGTNSTDIFKVHGSGIYVDAGVAGPTGSGISNEQIKAGRLAAVEVSVTVLSDFAIEQMRKRTFTSAAKSEFIAKNSYQYSKLIPVPGT